MHGIEASANNGSQQSPQVTDVDDAPDSSETEKASSWRVPTRDQSDCCDGLIPEIL